MSMEKYSAEWKAAENKKHGGWTQKHGDEWKWHYIQYGTEYSKGSYPTKAAAVEENGHKQITVEIWGGFHNQMVPIRIKITDWWLDEGIGYVMQALSESTRKRVEKHMCGYTDCMCGYSHGWKIEKVQS